MRLILNDVTESCAHPHLPLPAGNHWTLYSIHPCWVLFFFLLFWGWGWKVLTPPSMHLLPSLRQTPSLRQYKKSALAEVDQFHRELPQGKSKLSCAGMGRVGIGLLQTFQKEFLILLRCDWASGSLLNFSKSRRVGIHLSSLTAVCICAFTSVFSSCTALSNNTREPLTIFQHLTKIKGSLNL